LDTASAGGAAILEPCGQIGALSDRLPRILLRLQGCPVALVLCVGYPVMDDFWKNNQTFPTESASSRSMISPF
jgi:hypothetical protein